MPAPARSTSTWSRFAAWWSMHRRISRALPDANEWARRARGLARAGGRRHESLDDLALLCLDEPDVIELLTRAGVDVDDLRARLSEALAAVPAGADRSAVVLDERRAAPTNSVSRALHKALFHVVGGTSTRALGGVDVFPHCLAAGEPSFVRDLLAARGETRRTIVERIAHGCLVEDLVEHESTLHGGLGQVVVHDDPFTTQELVVEALRDVLGCGEDEATAHMLAVHGRRSGVVYEGPWEEAQRLRAELRARAVARSMPLYVEVRVV